MLRQKFVMGDALSVQVCRPCTWLPAAIFMPLPALQAPYSHIVVCGGNSRVSRACSRCALGSGLFLHMLLVTSLCAMAVWTHPSRDAGCILQDYVQTAGKQLGINLRVSSFVRVQVGEGLQKSDKDFASEVAEALNNS